MVSKQLDIKRDGIHYVTDRHAIYKCREISGPALYLLRRIAEDEWLSVSITEEDLRRGNSIVRDFFTKKENPEYAKMRFYNGCPIMQIVNFEDIKEHVNTFIETLSIKIV